MAQLAKLGQEFGVWKRTDGRLVVKYRDETNRLRQVTTFTKVAEANQFVMDAYQRWPGGKSSNGTSWSVSQMIAAYLADREASHLHSDDPKATTLERDRAGVKRILAEPWARTKAEELKRSQVSAWWKRMREETPPLSDNTIRNYTSVLSGAYKWAIDQDRVSLDVPPVPRFKVSTVKNGQALSPFQLQRIIRAAPEEYRVFFHTLAYTGMRIEEVCRLDVMSVNLKRAYIQGGIKTRAGKNRKMSIPGWLVAMLAPHVEGRPGDSPLFVNSRGNRVQADVFRRRVWRQTVDRAAIPHATPHWLRHSLATRLAEDGASSYELKNHFGWADSRPADLYVKAAEEAQKSIGAKLEGYHPDASEEE